MHDQSRPRLGAFYKHFKGKTYQIISIAKDADTLEEQVVYQALYGNFTVYVRPLKEFVEKLDKQKYPEAEQEFRFEQIVFSEDETSNLDGRENNNNWSSSNVLQQDENVKVVTKNIDQLFLDFLDAETSSEKLELLYQMKEHMDSRIVNNIAASMDLPVDEDNVEAQFNFIEQNLKQRIRFECTRFRG